MYKSDIIYTKDLICCINKYIYVNFFIYLFFVCLNNIYKNELRLD